MNTAVETLPLWLWCEASCTTGEENSDSPISSDSQMCGWWIKAADRTFKIVFVVAHLGQKRLD